MATILLVAKSKGELELFTAMLGGDEYSKGSFVAMENSPLVSAFLAQDSAILLVVEIHKEADEDYMRTIFTRIEAAVDLGKLYKFAVVSEVDKAALLQEHHAWLSRILDMEACAGFICTKNQNFLGELRTLVSNNC